MPPRPDAPQVTRPQRALLPNLLLFASVVFMLPVSAAESESSARPSSTESKSAARFEFTPDGRCAAETQALQKQQSTNDDIHLRTNADLTVMFHGNRYVIARSIVDAYQSAHPGIKISYTTLPPGNTIGVLLPGMLEQGLQQGTQEVQGIEPDVVMLPTKVGDNLTSQLQSKGVYSNVHGIVMLSRKGALTSPSLDQVVNSSLRFVLPGNNPSLSIYSVLESRLGADTFQRILASRTGFSNLKHHRYVPLRVAAGCEDVGFQYLQAVPELQRVYPNAFDYTPVPTTAEDFKGEASSVYTVTKAKHAQEAQRFAEFMQSDAAQAILRRFNLQRE